MLKQSTYSINIRQKHVTQVSFIVIEERMKYLVSCLVQKKRYLDGVTRRTGFSWPEF